MRSIDDLPSQGSEQPWRLSMSYIIDVPDLPLPAHDGVLQFTRSFGSGGILR